MEKLDEKANSVFLYSKNGYYNDVPVRAFTELKKILDENNITLTAENFNQFFTDFKAFTDASSIDVAVNTDQQANALDKDGDTAEKLEQTEKKQPDNNQGPDLTSEQTARAAEIESNGQVNDSYDPNATQLKAGESIKHVKPSSLLSMKA